MLAIGLALLQALAGCAAPPARSASDERPTIVSLNLCADAILAQVTAPGQLLAVSHYSHNPGASPLPATMRRFPATGGTVEEIAALVPDLVIGDAFTPPATRSALERLGIGFVALPIDRDLAASKAQVRLLAELAGHPARGEALVGRIERSLAAAAPPAGWRQRTALVWQGGGIVAGDDSLVAELLGKAGFAPAAAARGLGQGAIVSLEQMLADPPQVILAAGSPGAEENRLLHHPALARLGDVRRASFEPGYFYCGGPSIPRALARLRQIRGALGR
ncbi:MAG: ABC transporter substrate-binding protein [Novosphingobium sp.]|nr:ABC transporter substrate-binding protein [Novosphingobium sp.]